MYLSQESVAVGSQHVAMSLQLVSSLVDSYQHVTGGDVSVCGVSAVDDDHMSVCVCTYSITQTVSLCHMKPFYEL